MAKYTFEEIKTLLLKSINEEHIEAELRLVFKDKPDEYMITIYDDMCTFQRCGNIERLTIKSQARNAEERQKFRRFKRGIAKLTSFWTPT